jgi:hypothetical protein
MSARALGMTGSDGRTGAAGVDPAARYRRHLLPLIDQWRARRARVGIFGAGPHTDELLSHVPELDGPFLVAVLDNDIDRQRTSYRGRPVHPSAWAEGHLDVVLCSSYVNEARLAVIVAPSGCEVVTSQPLAGAPSGEGTAAVPFDAVPPAIAGVAAAAPPAAEQFGPTASASAPAPDLTVLIGVPGAGKSRRLIHAVNEARADGRLARVFLCRENPRVAHKERDRTLRCRDPKTWCDLDGFLTSEETIVALDEMPADALAAVDDSQSFSVAVAQAVVRAATRGVRCIVSVPSPQQLQVFRDHGVAPTELTLSCQRGCGEPGTTAVLTEKGHTLTVCGECLKLITEEAAATVREHLTSRFGSPRMLQEPLPCLDMPEWPTASPSAAREVDAIANELDGDRSTHDAWVPSATLLDLGCGMGARAIALARKGYHVTGVDPDAALVSIGRIVDRVFARRHVAFHHEALAQWLERNGARYDVVCAPASSEDDGASPAREWTRDQFEAIAAASRHRLLLRLVGQESAAQRKARCAQLAAALRSSGLSVVRVLHEPDLSWCVLSAVRPRDESERRT